MTTAEKAPGAGAVEVEPKIVGTFQKKDGSTGRMTWMGDGLAHFTCDDCGKFVGDCGCEGDDENL